MSNVQLTSKEAITVYVEIGSNRILALCPQHAKPLLSQCNIRYVSQDLIHAKDIERWVAKYRQQQEQDAEIATYRQIKRESQFRKSIQDAIVERNKHVNKFNQDLNNVLMRLNNEKYESIMKAKAKPQFSTLAEMSEMSKSHDNDVLDFAASSPCYKNPGDQRATGGAVMREIEKIEHDKRR